MLGCEDSSYVMYISHEWDEYEVVTHELDLFILGTISFACSSSLIECLGHSLGL